MLQKLLRVVIGLYGVYLALSLLVVMPVLNIMAPRILRETTNRELRSELIIFNPFTLAVEIRGASITEARGHKPLALKSLRVDLSLESIWATGVVLDAFLVEDLDVHVLRYEDGQFHFADLLSEDESVANTNDASASPLYLTIKNVAIDAHTLRYTDATRPGPYTTVQQDFVLKTRNVTTVPRRQGDGELDLTSDGGGRLRWSGDMDIAAGLSHGNLSLDNIDLTHVWRYNASDLEFIVHSARFGASIDYRVDWSGDLQLLLTDSSLRFHDIDVMPKDTTALPDTGITLDELSVGDIGLDLQAQDLHIGQLSSRGLIVQGFDNEGQASLQRMFVPAGAEADSAGTASADSPGSNDEAEPGEEGGEWLVRVDSISSTANEVRWKTDYLAPELMVVAPLDLSVSDFSMPAQGNTAVEVALRINDTVTLDVDGTVNPSSGDGLVNVALGQWQLEWLNPLLNEQARTDFRSGAFSLDSRLALKAFAPATINGGLRIDGLVTELHETGDKAFTLESLVVDAFETDVGEQLTRVNTLTLEAPAGSLHIREDGRMNINGVIRDTGSAESDSGATDEENDAAPWGLILGELNLHNGRLDFADSSLPLPFKTVVEGIEAQIKDLDSTSDAPLSLDFRGSVDGYAPVLIQGIGQPMSDAPSGELRFNFRGIDIATMSPYAGTYAGYTIDSGTLTLDLRYALSGQAIDGDNRIVISQMQLGEPVDSELAIDVPLKLGLALLTDSEGVIDLDVPVSGSVDDPEFSLGKVIGRAIGNIIVKAVTAPFSLLANLVGSDDDLENVAFPVGSDTPDASGLAALTSLGEALNARPQLRLQVAGGFDPIDDGEALRVQALGASLMEEGLSEVSLKNRDEAFVDAVERRYAALSVDGGDAESRESDEAAEPPGIDEQWQALVNRQELAATALQDLATNRAAAAKRELVTRMGVDAARIAISFDAALGSAGVRMSVDG